MSGFSIFNDSFAAVAKYPYLAFSDFCSQLFDTLEQIDFQVTHLSSLFLQAGGDRRLRVRLL